MKRRAVLLVISLSASTALAQTDDSLLMQGQIDQLRSEQQHQAFRAEGDAIIAAQQGRPTLPVNEYDPEGAVAAGIKPSPPIQPRPPDDEQLAHVRNAQTHYLHQLDRYNQELERYNNALERWTQLHEAEAQTQARAEGAGADKKANPGPSAAGNAAAEPAASAPRAPVYHYNFRIKSGLIGLDFTRPLTAEEQSAIARQIEKDQSAIARHEKEQQEGTQVRPSVAPTQTKVNPLRP